MSPRWIATSVIAVAAAASWIVFARGSSPPVQLGSSPVVVELFTSQGCSSCPPADDLIRTIQRDPAMRSLVIPLAFHVDYWDHLGWRDPFSSRAWTQRQMQYVRGLRLPSAYTPQAIVNGTRQMVGSNARELYAAIAEESRRKSDATLSLRVSGDEAIVGGSPQPGRELIVLVYENDITTSVRGGENEGRAIANDAIVRRMKRVSLGGSEQRVPLEIDPSWKRGNLGVVALIQEPKTLRIEAAARVALQSR